MANSFAQHRTSALLREMVADKRDAIGAGEVLERLGDKGLGFLMLLFAAASAMPIPGMSALASLPILAIAVHILLGKGGASLVNTFAERKIGLVKLRFILGRAADLFEQLESYIKPRPGYVVCRRCDRRIGAVLILLISILLMLPVPLSNLPLALSIAILATAIIERDKILTLLAWISTALALGIFVLLIRAYFLLFEGIAGEVT